MAHELDFSTGIAGIAYRGNTPWHGLGQTIPEGATVEEIQRLAGLNWKAERAMVEYWANWERRTVPSRSVLYRNDTGAPLGVVSDRYKVVQPSDVLGFFRTLVDDVGGFEIETAGSLFDGRRIWALAKVGEAQEVGPRDYVAPYLLLATSFDGTMATVAEWTTVRVVCNNTLRAAVGDRGEQAKIRILHGAKFDAAQLRADLGIMGKRFDQMMDTFRHLSGVSMTMGEFGDFADHLIAPADSDKFFASKLYLDLATKFAGQALGHDGDRNAYQALNAVTEYVDHQAGRKQSNRLQSAWFGQGADLKVRALDILMEEFA